MGQSYYVCTNCNESFGDYWDGIHFCDCGKSYCCSECAEDNGFRYDTNGKYDEFSCGYCREERFDEYQILSWTLDTLNMTKEEVVEILKKKSKRGE